MTMRYAVSRMTPAAFVLAAVLIAIVAYVVWRSYHPHASSTAAALFAYTTDLTALAAAGKLDPICCRDEEIERVTRILLRRTKNNPLLIGEPGVGKSAIVEAFAQHVVAGGVPDALRRARVLALRIQDLMAGTKYRGAYEERVQQLLAELERAPYPVILFIDEVHLLEAAGRSEGSLSLTDLLKPGLARGDIRIIGATTWVEYEASIRPNAALDRRFQLVLVDEPNRTQALAMLRGLRAVYEAHHGVEISDAALEAAVRLADEQIDTRRLPDSAIDLIDEAAAKVAIEAERRHHVPLGVIHAAARGKRGSTAHRPVVGVEDIAAVVDQWVMHGREDRARDPRNS